MKKLNMRPLSDQMEKVGDILVNTAKLLNDPSCPNELAKELIATTRAATKVLWMLLDGQPLEHVEAEIQSGSERVKKLEDLCNQRGWLKES